MFFQGFKDEILSKMSTHEVSSILSRVDGLNTHQLPSYQQSVEENNINGMVLNQCELDELGKVLGMKFGDWQLFRTVILSLREAEEIGQQQQHIDVEDDTETAHNTHRNRANSVRSIHFQEVENSGSSASAYESESSRTRLGYNTQASVETKRLESSETGVVFDAIPENPESPPREKLLKRNDSVVAQLMYESGLLHRAMQSFAEEDEESHGEEEQVVEVEVLDKPSSKKRGLPVQFSLTSQRSSTSPDHNHYEGNGNQNAYNFVTSERDPLLTRRMSDIEFHLPDGVMGSPKPILKKPKNNNISGSQVSLTNNQSLLDMDMTGSEPDLTFRKQAKSPNLLQTDKSISLSSTGFVAVSDHQRPSLVSSKGNSIDSLEVINENTYETPRKSDSNSSSEKGSPQKMNIMSIEDSIKQFTLSRARTTSLSGGDRTPSFDEYSGSSSTGSFKMRSDSLRIYEDGDVVVGMSEKPTSAESFV